MARAQLTNNASTVLATGISAGSATITVLGGKGALFPSTGYFFVTLTDGTNIEICKCTSRSGDVLTVTRAQEGTVAYAFNGGDKVELRITAGVIRELAALTDNIDFDSRATLRSNAADDRTLAVIDGAGIYMHVVGSTETDDDETCFTTSTGAWLLISAHYDLIEPLISARIAEVWDKFVNVPFTSSITSVNSATLVSQTVTALGAVVGATVILTPPASLQVTTYAHLHAAADCTVANQVNVYFRNTSGGTISSIPTTGWNALVINP